MIDADLEQGNAILSYLQRGRRKALKQRIYYL